VTINEHCLVTDVSVRIMHCFIAEGVTLCSSEVILYDLPFCRWKVLKSPIPFSKFRWLYIATCFTPFAAKRYFEKKLAKFDLIWQWMMPRQIWCKFYRLTTCKIWSTEVWFLQRAQCSLEHCKRCISYGNSVRPSVTRRYCVKTTVHSMVQFAPLDSKMCLVL